MVQLRKIKHKVISSQLKKILNDLDDIKTSGMKLFKNHCSQTLEVIHAFLFAVQKTGKSSFFTPFMHLGFKAVWINNGFNFNFPLAFPPNKTVLRLLGSFRPAVFLVLCLMVLVGGNFQKRAASSTLKIWSSLYPPSLLIGGKCSLS